MKFLSYDDLGYMKFNYDGYTKFLMNIEQELGIAFLKKYTELGFFHDYCIKDLEIISSYKKKNSAFLTLSYGYKDDSPKFIIEYKNLKSIKYSNDCEYQSVYLYGVISFNKNKKTFKHEILHDNGKITIECEQILFN